MNVYINKIMLSLQSLTLTDKTRSCLLNVADHMQLNIRGTFDVILYDHEFFGLHTKKVKIDDPYGVFEGKTYMILIGGNEIHRGPFMSSASLFPFENVPLGLLAGHKVELVVLDVSVLPDSAATITLIHESFDFAIPHQYYEMPWPTKGTNEKKHLRFIGGLCGLSHCDQLPIIDAEYVTRTRRALPVALSNGVLVDGLSHLNEKNEYHIDAHESAHQYSMSKILALMFSNPNEKQIRADVFYETMKFPMKVSDTSAVYEMRFSADGLANIEILSDERVESVQIKTVERSRTLEEYECTKLISSPAAVTIGDFSGQQIFNCLNSFRKLSHYLPGAVVVSVTFAAPVRGDVWLKLDRLIIGSQWRYHIAHNYIGNRLDLSAMDFQDGNVLW